MRNYSTVRFKGRAIAVQQESLQLSPTRLNGGGFSKGSARTGLGLFSGIIPSPPPPVAVDRFADKFRSASAARK